MGWGLGGRCRGTAKAATWPRSRTLFHTMPATQHKQNIAIPSLPLFIVVRGQAHGVNSPLRSFNKRNSHGTMEAEKRLDDCNLGLSAHPFRSCLHGFRACDFELTVLRTRSIAVGLSLPIPGCILMVVQGAAEFVSGSHLLPYRFFSSPWHGAAITLGCFDCSPAHSTHPTIQSSVSSSHSVGVLR